ncbi:guanosine-5'-triphosphate,3'-diphosphate diphosphatase [Flocculibacter collagenilyticus]|uniref:guanosine-5'-triphosphate,3'-diphosphate diphosphatase n=1 Tax=Flocculibacter collagenilyticus TaxID=2744479 RepID=UPI0018F6DFA9|nr:guanosine-5'-triphosphate,3'-diphosphate diphosphatase [Flocculibacter collagenilyticus]
MEKKSTQPLQKDVYVVIDLGSNSFHMMMVKVVSGSVQVISRIKRKVRLAAGLNEADDLSQEAMERGWECLSLFAERLQDIPSSNIRIVGTATMRLANNADVFSRRARDILGHSINIISGDEEAKTIYLGATHTTSSAGKSLVVDIGGASTEIIIGDGLQVHHATSLNMGCVTFFEHYFRDNHLSEKNFAAAITAAEHQLEIITDKYLALGWQSTLGASGTIQALQEIMIVQGMDEVITLAKLKQIMNQAIECDHMGNLNIEGLSQERRQVFPSGLAILIAIFNTLKITGMTLSGGALREGLLYSMLPELESVDIRQRTVESLITRYHIDRSHAQRVAEQAVRLATQIKDRWQLSEFEGLDMLHSAAMLHETGLLIEYKNNHHHGAYVLSHSDLPGFSAAQKKLITALVYNCREDIEASRLQHQTTSSVTLATRLCRLLRLAIILSMRRNDEALPKAMISTEGERLSLHLPQGWLAAHPLMRSELEAEVGYQQTQGWPLTIIY